MSGAAEIDLAIGEPHPLIRPGARRRRMRAAFGPLGAMLDLVVDSDRPRPVELEAFHRAAADISVLRLGEHGWATFYGLPNLGLFESLYAPMAAHPSDRGLPRREQGAGLPLTVALVGADGIVASIRQSILPASFADTLYALERRALDLARSYSEVLWRHEQASYRNRFLRADSAAAIGFRYRDPA